VDPPGDLGTIEEHSQHPGDPQSGSQDYPPDKHQNYRIDSGVSDITSGLADAKIESYPEDHDDRNDTGKGKGVDTSYGTKKSSSSASLCTLIPDMLTQSIRRR
jgi:hypothetical protein